MMRLWWALGCCLVGIAVLVCLLPGTELPGNLGLNDKLSHVLGHAGLAVYFSGLVARHAWWKVFVFLLVFGGVVEVAQYHMQLGRQGEARDMIANSCGAVLGLGLGRLGLERWPQWADRLLGRRVAS
jgi:VanZ family protein